MGYGDAPVTCGGKVCIDMLTTAGWLPRTTMQDVFTTLGVALIQAKAEVDARITVKRDYGPPPAPALDRLKTDQYKNSRIEFLKNLQAISADQAAKWGMA